MMQYAEKYDYRINYEYWCAHNLTKMPKNCKFATSMAFSAEPTCIYKSLNNNN